MTRVVKTNQNQITKVCDTHLQILCESKQWFEHPTTIGTSEDPCDFCTQEFLTHRGYVKRVWTCTFTLDKIPFCKVFCDDCIVSFTEGYSARLIMKHVSKNYSCSHCGYSLAA
jgi:hypothetical protein